MLGIGGGGDVVGSLATARLCQSYGTEFRLGGVAWERFPIDPYPGPRGLEEIRGGKPLSSTAMLAGAGTTTPEGARFAESGMAEFICSDTVLVDIQRGPAAVADGLAEAAAKLGCDLCLLVDVGGDVLARGDEPGLASPLCDAVMLAAGAELAGRLPTLAAIYGAGCDGELTAHEVLERLAELARVGGLLGARGLPAAVVEQIEAAGRRVPTEASLMAARCARGEIGTVEIRGGRRTVELTPLGALTFYFDPRRAAKHTAPLARAVARANSLEAAQESLAALGVRTELDYERERALEAERAPGQ